jgi:lysozyme family protein
MSALPKQTAIDIYRRQYIVRPGFLPLVAIDAAVAEEVIDTGVNMGPARPTRFFRRAVNATCNTRLPITDSMDAVTVKAWADCRANLGPRSCVAMLDSLDGQQRAEYDRLVRANPRLRVFYRGWINHRVGNVKRGRCV